MESRLKWLVVICLKLTLTSAMAFAGQDAVKFKQQKIQIASKKITVEVAEDQNQHEQGLMFRTKLKPDQGMLFIFKEEKILNFWMKNTLINLSIAYFNKEKKIVDIQEMKAIASVMQQSLPTYPSASPAMYALEMSEGWFKKNKIQVGDQFKFVK